MDLLGIILYGNMEWVDKVDLEWVDDILEGVSWYLKWIEEWVVNIFGISWYFGKDLETWFGFTLIFVLFLCIKHLLT